MGDLHRLSDQAVERVHRVFAGRTSHHAEGEVRIPAAINGLLARLAVERHLHEEAVKIRLLGLIPHAAFIARRLVIVIVAEDAGGHGQQILERHGPLGRFEIQRGSASVHDLIDGRRKPERRPGLHRRPHDRRSDALGCLTRGMRRLAIVAVKIFLKYQLAVPRDQEAVDLGRIDLVLRRIDDHLHDLFHARAVDAHVLQASRRPAVVEGRRGSVGIGAGVLAPTIEIALDTLAPEIVASAAIGEGEREHLVVRIVRAAQQNAILLLAPPLADQLHDIAFAGQPKLGAESGANVALHVPQQHIQRTVRPLLGPQIESEFVQQRLDDAPPAVAPVLLENYPRGSFAKIDHRCGLDPMAENAAFTLEFAPERTLTARQVEDKLAPFHPDRHDPASHVSAIRRPRLLNDQRTPRVRAETLFRFPQTYQFIHRSCRDRPGKPVKPRWADWKQRAGARPVVIL